MKMKAVLQESLQLYRKNLPELLLALIVELALRGICLAPMLFLALEGAQWLSWLCVPMYLLIALPARENYALALQDMQRGGHVLSVQLISTDNYLRKLLRGLRGTLLILLWAALPIAGVTAALMAYNGAVDFFTLLRILDQLGGGSSTTGIFRCVGIIAATFVLPLIGCAVHSGTRHAVALGSRKLLKGHRGKLALLWMIGLVTLLPFAAVLLGCMGEYVIAFVSQLKNSLTNGIVFEPLGIRPWIVAAAAVVLLLPLLPLKNMLPAVYLRMAKEKTYAQA